jgi:hypothetical protein
MKQEFTTVKGKIIIENNVLYIRTLDLDTYAFVFTFLLPIAIPVFYITWLLNFQDNPKNYISVIFWGLVALMQLPRLYNIIIRKSYSNRIPLNHIVSYEIKPDDLGLETVVYLKLKSGRYRRLSFRNLEKQFEPLLEIISARLTQAMLA